MNYCILNAVTSVGVRDVLINWDKVTYCERIESRTHISFDHEIVEVVESPKQILKELKLASSNNFLIQEKGELRQ